MTPKLQNKLEHSVEVGVMWACLCVFTRPPPPPLFKQCLCPRNTGRWFCQFSHCGFWRCIFQWSYRVLCVLSDAWVLRCMMSLFCVKEADWGMMALVAYVASRFSE